MKQADAGFADFGLDFENPDFVKYAESYGASGYRVEATDDLVPTLQKCLDTPGVHVVEAPIDYTENRILSEMLAAEE